MQFALFYNKAGCVELNRAAAIHSFKRTGLEEKKGVKSKMAKDKMYGKTLRKNFARHEEIVEMPNLLALQKKSYQWFLDTGLREVFSDVASISNYAGNLELSFIDYKMDEAPKYDVLECKARDATYAAPLKVSVRLYNKETGEIKEQEIFMGDFPLMTDSGTFVINGAERVVVSQLVRSPGIYYGKEIDLKTDLPLLTSTVIPYRGAWLEYETDANDIFYVRIDKNRKIPITSFIRAIGVKTDAEIKELFGEDPLLLATLDKDPAHSADEALIEIYKKMRPGEPPSVESATSLMDMMFFDMRRYDISAVGRYKYNKKLDIARRITGHKLLETVTDPMTGEVVAEADTVLTREKATEISRRGINNVVVESADGAPVKVFGNGMVFVDDFSDYLGGMTAEELGVKEKVRFTVLKEIIESGELGKLTVSSFHYMIYKNDEYFDVEWRRKKGAGPILVNLVHDVDLLRYLLGEPVAVQGMQSSAARGFETEDSAVVNVRFADGALASMTISDATASPWNWEATAREDPQYRPFDADAYFIGGTKGALSLPRLHQFSYDGASNWHKPLQMEIPAVDPALPHKMQLKHFVKVVRREVEPVVTPADNVKTLTLLNAIKEAAETGQLVEL